MIKFFPMKQIVYIFLTLFILPQLTTAQEVSSNDSSNWGNIQNFQLPPLKVLLDAAYQKAPTIKYFEAINAEQERILKSTKRDWLRNMGIDASYKYGRLGLTQIGSETEAEIINTSSTESQNWFNVGVYVRMPLLSIVDKRNQKKIQQLKIEQSEAKVEQMHEELTERIIREYKEASLALEVLKLRSELVQTNNAQIIMSEANFKRGKVDVGELARLKELQIKAKIEYEITLHEFQVCVLVLENLTGLNIGNMNNDKIK